MEIHYFFALIYLFLHQHHTLHMGRVDGNDVYG